jgi:hypothetical protein
MALEPRAHETRLILTVPLTGTAMKARLPPMPAHPRAVMMLLESLSAWYRLPITAAIDADALGARHHAERWCEFLGDIPGLDISVEWVSRPSLPKERRDRFFHALGDLRSTAQLATVAATGQR